MSYSFSVQAPTKAEAEIKIRDELVKVCESQPVHTVDCDQAFEAAAAFLKLLADDPTRDVYVSVSGSIWKSEAGVQSAGVNVSALLQQRKEPA